MLTKTLAATAAVSMLVGGGSALAQSKSSATASPKQPIPYSQLDAYMRASPKARASKDWWAGSATAPTGMPTDTSATTSKTTDTSVNPPQSLPSTPPINGGAMPSPMSGDTTSPPPPTDPK